MYKKHLLLILLFLFIFSIPICGNWLFLLNNGELMPIEEIVDRQLNSKEYCIVGLATRNQGYYYKREMYKRVLPDVFVHGSSRVMQFKKDYFSGRMFNSGGTMSSVNEGFSFIKDVFAIRKPKIMIIGIDYWWFNKSVIEPTTSIRPPLPLSHQISFRSYLLPYQWLWQGKLSFPYYFNTMNPLNYTKANFNKGIGVDGAMNRTGYAPDGSYCYTKTAIGKEESIDKRFEGNLKLLALNDSRYEKEALVNDIHFSNFLAMVDYINNNNVKVIFFIPPVAPMVENKLKDFALIKDLRQKLTLANIPFYDFHDPSVLNTSDCEFYDATHGGDLLYARILNYIAKQEPELNAYIDSHHLNTVISELKNIAMVPKSEVTSEPEVDFLELGCDKSSQFNLRGEPGSPLAKIAHK